MATVSVFNITNISPTRAINFTSAAARDSWFDSYAVGTSEVISSLVDVNAMMVSVPFSGGDIIADFTNHYARINQGDVTRYYFINDYRRLNRSQVILNLKLDTVMTFMLSPDSPLQIGSKTLVLREHRDRFNAGAAVYDDMPESTSGEMILKSTSAIAGAARLHVLLRTIPGDDSGIVSGRPYWFPYMEGTTPSLSSQSSTYGIRFFVTAKTLWEASTPPWTDNAIIIMFSGAVVINGVPYTPAATDGVALTGFLNGSNYEITITYFNKTTHSTVEVIALTDSTALVKASAGVECRVKEQTRPINNIQWTTAATYNPTGYTRAQTSIDLYDGAISKYVILPYNPLTITEYLSNFIVIINSFADSTINENIFDMNTLYRAYSTTVTMPSASYTFTTTGVSVPLKTVAELTITHDRPNTETDVELFFTMPEGLSFYVPLPDSTAMTITEIRDAIFADPALLGATAIDWVATKVGVDKIRFTSIKFGPLGENTYSVQFDNLAPTVADGTFIRTQQGVLPATRVALNDPKLYTSQFYLPTVTLAGISVPLYREYIPAATTAPTVAITYNSNLEDVGMIVGDSTNFKTLDEGIRVIQLPNRMPLYATDTSTYFQYIKEYDDRLFSIQQSATARNAAIGSVNSALSAVVPMVGNESMGVGIAGTRLARAGINIAADIWNAVDNYKSANINRQKSILEMSLSSIDIASTSVEFLIANDLDKIRFSINSVKTEMLNYLDDLFYYQGYATFEMKVPDFDSRTNFNYLMALVDIDMNDLDVVVSDEILADIYNRFKSGITIFHNNAGFIDWNQVNENWEG